MNALLALALLAAAPFHHPHDVVNAVALSPDFARDGTVFCASAGTMNLFLVSEDRGSSWRNSRSGMFGWEVLDLAVAPDWSNSRTAFAALGPSGLQRTRDGGRSWGARLFEGPVSRVVAGAANEQARVLAFASGSQVLLSLDDGDTRRAIFQGARPVVELALSPGFPGDGTLAVTTRDGLVHVTRDGGETWTANDLRGLGSGIAFSPDFARDTTLWVATFPEGLQVSGDGGASFARVAGPLPANLNDVVVAPDWPASRDLFVAARDEGVFRSRDGGATWARCGLDVALSDQGWNHYLQLALSPDWPRDPTVYCAAFEGLYHSRDGGATWVESVLDTTNIGRHVDVSPAFARDRTVVALAYGNPALVSEDGGESWDMRSRGVGVMSTYAIGISPAFERDGMLFLGAERGLRRSRDRGRTWESIALEPEGPQERGWAYEIRSIRFSPDFDADRGVFAQSEAGLFLSDDGGDTWRRVAVPVERARRLAVSPGWPADRTLFVGGQDLRRSDDGGATWSERLAGDNLQAVVCAPDYLASGEVYAVALESGFHRSSDRGRTFEAVPDALGGFCPTALRLSPDFVRDGTLWVATLSGGIRVSRDRGRTFEPLLPLGGPVDSVFDLAFSPEHSRDRTAFACTHEGVFRTLDGGASWVLSTTEALYDDHRDPWLLRGSGWETLGGAQAFVFGEHRSRTAGDRAVLPFAGRGVALLGSRGPDRGRLRVFLDGVEVGRADAYAPQFEPAALLFESAQLEPAFHALEVEVTGDAHPSSAGAWVAVDAARVRYEWDRAGALPVLAPWDCLTLAPDVSYGRDVRGSLTPRPTGGPGEVIHSQDDALRRVLIALALLAAFVLLVRRARAGRS